MTQARIMELDGDSPRILRRTTIITAACVLFFGTCASVILVNVIELASMYFATVR